MNFATLIKYLGVVRGLVNEVETILGRGTGDTKKAVVVAALTAILQTAEPLIDAKNPALAADVDALVEYVVGEMNKWLKLAQAADVVSVAATLPPQSESPAPAGVPQP